MMAICFFIFWPSRGCINYTPGMLVMEKSPGKHGRVSFWPEKWFSMVVFLDVPSMFDCVRCVPEKYEHQFCKVQVRIS